MTFLKDPDAMLDYGVDWTAALSGQAVVTASSWQVSPADPGGVVIGPSSFTASAATVRVSGGRPGHVYRLTNRVTLSDGQVDERSLAIRVDER